MNAAVTCDDEKRGERIKAYAKTRNPLPVLQGVSSKAGFFAGLETCCWYSTSLQEDGRSTDGFPARTLSHSRQPQ